MTSKYITYYISVYTNGKLKSLSETVFVSFKDESQIGELIFKHVKTKLQDPELLTIKMKWRICKMTKLKNKVAIV